MLQILQEYLEPSIYKNETTIEYVKQARGKKGMGDEYMKEIISPKD
jgi:hypothetical protein